MLQLTRGRILVKLHESLEKSNLLVLLCGTESMANAVLANCNVRALAPDTFVWDTHVRTPLITLGNNPDRVPANCLTQQFAFLMHCHMSNHLQSDP